MPQGITIQGSRVPAPISAPAPTIIAVNGTRSERNAIDSANAKPKMTGPATSRLAEM
jgi:hypothetical protein